MASTAPKHARPLSPHLGIYKWGPAMTVSILHRITGSGMATVGTVLLLWWLAALASGPVAYASFMNCFTVESGGLNIIGYVVLIGLTLSFFQHMATGVRHFVLDSGAGYELKINRTGAVLTMVFSIVATAGLWAYVILGK